MVENEQGFEVLIRLIKMLMRHTCQILLRFMKVIGPDIDPRFRVKEFPRSKSNKHTEKLRFALKKVLKH